APRPARAPGRAPARRPRRRRAARRAAPRAPHRRSGGWARESGWGPAAAPAAPWGSSRWAWTSGSDRGDHLARGLCVAADLVGELCDRAEATLGPQALDELHLQLLAVEI